jgi:hypothetical protein
MEFRRIIGGFNTFSSTNSEDIKIYQNSTVAIARGALDIISIYDGTDPIFSIPLITDINMPAGSNPSKLILESNDLYVVGSGNNSLHKVDLLTNTFSYSVSTGLPSIEGFSYYQGSTTGIIGLSS